MHRLPDDNLSPCDHLRAAGATHPVHYVPTVVQHEYLCDEHLCQPMLIGCLRFERSLVPAGVDHRGIAVVVLQLVLVLDHVHHTGRTCVQRPSGDFLSAADFAGTADLSGAQQPGIATAVVVVASGQQQSHTADV